MTHGDTKNRTATGEYQSWSNMIQRCTNPNRPDFSRYGELGISVCERWINSFENFLEDLGRKPTKDHSLDRINVYGNYEPSNCRWATEKEQQNNKRNNNYITHNGETKTITQWSELIGISAYAIRKRLTMGWSIEEALSRKLVYLEPQSIIQYDLEGNYITEWSSINKARKAFKVTPFTIKQKIKDKAPFKGIFLLEYKN